MSAKIVCLKYYLIIKSTQIIVILYDFWAFLPFIQRINTNFVIESYNKNIYGRSKDHQPFFDG